MENYILTYGAIAVFIGVLLEGEVLFLTGVLFASLGKIHLLDVLMAGYLGILTHDSIFFALGKTQGRLFFENRPALNHRLQKILVPFNKRQWVFFLSYRFLIGFRMILLALFGINNLSIQKFLVITLVGGLVWIAFYGYLGYYFSDLVLNNLDFVKAQKYTILGAILGLTFLYKLPSFFASHLGE